MDPEGGMMNERRKVEKGVLLSVNKSVSESEQILKSPFGGWGMKKRVLKEGNTAKLKKLCEQR